MHNRLANRTKLQALIAAAAIEIIPLGKAAEQLGQIPLTTPITITCSDKLGLEHTLDLAMIVRAQGNRVIPHLAARQIPDQTTLTGYLDRLAEVGIRDIYIIGGDRAEPVGEFRSALDLLRTIRQLDPQPTSIGVACYPEGHPAISDEQLLADLRSKQEYADYMVNQLCFEAETLLTWLQSLRQAGIQLPLRLGLAAPVTTVKLVELSAKIGVGTSLRYLTKQHGILSHLLRPQAYQPEQLLNNIPDQAMTALGIDGLHVFSFNQIEATVAWQQHTAVN